MLSRFRSTAGLQWTVRAPVPGSATPSLGKPEQELGGPSVFTSFKGKLEMGNVKTFKGLLPERLLSLLSVCGSAVLLRTTCGRRTSVA